MEKLTAKMHHLIDLLNSRRSVLSSFVHRHGVLNSSAFWSHMREPYDFVLHVCVCVSMRNDRRKYKNQ